ncbi:hypothetical protein C8R42DRAFT_717442 [Lentinula raphanica]|nr:hypothetical protein C8R42DRAFT_717442 [Lentinula raphanica]
MRLDPTYMLSLLLLSAVSMSAPLDTGFKHAPTNCNKHAVTKPKPIVHSLATRANKLAMVHMKFLPPHNLDGGSTYCGPHAEAFQKALQEWLRIPSVVVPDFVNNLNEDVEDYEEDNTAVPEGHEDMESSDDEDTEDNPNRVKIAFWGEFMLKCKEESDGCYIQMGKPRLLGNRWTKQRAQFRKGDDVFFTKVLIVEN